MCGISIHGNYEGCDSRPSGRHFDSSMSSSFLLRTAGDNQIYWGEGPRPLMTVLVLHVHTCTCTAGMGMYMYMCICEYVLHACILCNPYSHEERLGNIFREL